MLKYHLQNCHPKREPEILLADEVYATDVPATSLLVPHVEKNDEGP